MTKEKYLEELALRKDSIKTEEDLLQLCKMHKEIPCKDRSWEYLKNEVGWDGSAESLRSWANRRLPKDKVESGEPESPNEVKLNADLYKEKTNIRDTFNAYRRTLRDEARIEDLKNSLIEAAKQFAELPDCLFDVSATESANIEFNAKKEAVLLLSDLHIGVDCDNFYNKYNTVIAKERLSKLLKETIEKCHRNDVEILHVLNLGDMINGLIHTNARLEQQLDVAEQIIVASELLANFMNEVQKAAPVVTYRSVYDNHSRAIANKNEHIEKEQFSKLIDWYVKERLSNTAIRFIDNEIDGGIGSLKLKNGKKIIFAHGHQDGINSGWQNFIGLTKEWVDYIILAHYHNAKEKTYNGSVVFVNGSIVGTEQYAFGKRLFSNPSQKLIIFEEDSGTYLDINIDVK